MSNNLTRSGPGRPKDPAKRDAILAAATTLFLEQGYSGTSMDAIAAAAGVSKLTVYSHFKDKEALFAAAVEIKCQGQMPSPIFHFDESQSVEQVLLRIARSFHELVTQDDAVNLMRLMAAQAGQDQTMARLFFEVGPQKTLLDMERLLAELDRRGLLRVAAPDRAADHFFSLIKGCHEMQVLIGCGEPMTAEEAEAHITDVVAMFLRAYAP